MIIAIDEAIPYLQEAFGAAGEIRPFSSRSVGPIDVRDADALVVRSVTRVGPDLLAGSSVRFVGTASVGTDHLDLTYLRGRGIRIANAAGCNANAVAEYLVAALTAVAERKGWDLTGKSIGIIGVGHIGSLVEKKTAALGMKPLLCDPPLREITGDSRYGFLEDVLGADILSLHVPLTAEGPHPTRHMIDHSVLLRLSARQFVINTSRGAVVSGDALKRALRERRIAGAVLDVWEDEPQIDFELLDLVDIGTAHIAGFSQEGKARGTAMVLDALCHFLGVEARWDGRGIVFGHAGLRPQEGTEGQDAVRSVVSQAYDIWRDDKSLRALKEMPAATAAEAFDRLRTSYPFRREFSHFIVELPEGTGIAGTFRGLGFQVSTRLC